MKSLSAIAISLIFAVPTLSSAQTKLEPGKISFQLFGDYYSVANHNTSSIEGKSGFWVRRIYVTYDQKLENNLSAQFRIEAKDPGDFSTSSNMEPFIKDAWVRYTEPRFRATFGLQPTPSFSPAETKLGYRPIEKTPLDLYRMNSSRDKGISVDGKLDASGATDYSLMIGDASGTKSSNGETRAFYGRIGHQLNSEFGVDLYADFMDKDGGTEWSTSKAEIFYAGKKLKGGVMVANQHRKSTSSTYDLGVWSVYVESPVSEKASPFIRVDSLNHVIPDAGSIEFYKMSPDGKPTLVMVGVRFRVNNSLEIVPSFTSVSYRKVGSVAKPDSDGMFRVTVSLKY